MADELLGAVIRLENEIQLQLQQEQTRADSWLAEVRNEQQERTQQIEQQLAAEDGRVLAAAKKQAEQQAEALIEGGRDYCHRLEELSDPVLVQLLARQLVKILPGAIDDHQDVED